MISLWTQIPQGQHWLNTYRGRLPLFACVLGFTETGLIPGISAAGATPTDRQYTAIADAEFLYHGPQPHPRYPLPPLQAGASPVLISRAIIAAQSIPLLIFNAGLPHAPAIPCIDLGGKPARCLQEGNALDRPIVDHLFQQGLKWGEKLATQATETYLILGECVVGGTTTALALLTGLGINAMGKVNSSHPTCNHEQKGAIVQQGLRKAEGRGQKAEGVRYPISLLAKFHPLDLVAAIGDPMQIVVAGMTLAASQTCGVMLAGGTQMLAVYALAQAIATRDALEWNPEQVVIGTTRWVAEDPTGDTIGLANLVGSVPLMATQLNFAQSRYSALRAYEQGFVKEGVGAGACAIAAHLYQNWNQQQLLGAIETLTTEYEQCLTS
ncbi:MAG: TIGR00303 family protein [Leptolyngbyaceae cyanobacterium bins.59]|nr:TIGR00303 family protein [Leptolyngbyaceae cyanobacterium bins.59]